MKDQNRDRIWELTAAKMHNEITGAESKELKLLLLSEDNDKIEQTVKDIYDTLAGAQSLKYSSLEKSWQSIYGYLKKKPHNF
jgi:Zn/Cd-binding protein ZinT